MSDFFTHSLQAWQSFYTFTGAAAATLIGLLFVALSFGAELTLSEHPRVMRNTFVTPSYLHFLEAALLSAVALAPTVNGAFISAFLIAAVILNLIFWLQVFRLMIKYYRHTAHLHDWIWNLTLPLLIYFVAWGTAMEIILDHVQALNLLALVTVALLVVGIENTWHTMGWTAEQRSQTHRTRKKSKH